MNTHIHMGEANKVKFMQQINEYSQADMNPPWAAAASTENIAQFKFNDCFRSTRHGNWAQRPCSNNNNALLYETPFTQMCTCVCVLCVCVCVCVTSWAQHINNSGLN